MSYCRGFLLIMLAGMVLMACGSTSNNDLAAAYTYPLCADSKSQCQGLETFQCAMNSLEAKYNHCSNVDDCDIADGPESSDCVNFCSRALINKNQKNDFLQEAKIEVHRYCSSNRCLADIYCPRTENETPSCVDGICTWTIGELHLPDGGI